MFEIKLLYNFFCSKNQFSSKTIHKPRRKDRKPCRCTLANKLCYKVYIELIPSLRDAWLHYYRTDI